jgi:hypothetical protein
MVMTIKTYQITDINILQLENEIRASDIATSLKGISLNGNDMDIEFNADIDNEDIDKLNLIVEQHNPIYEDNIPEIKLASASTYEGIPLVYATSKPIDHYVCFQGAGDSETTIGGGTKVVFHLTSKEDKVSKTFTFNEDIYIKDGYIISKEAPFGASLDIEILHPIYDIVLSTFGKEIPIFGTGWFPLDTEDRAFLPKGLRTRITVHNSRGIDETNREMNEQSPADFWVSGRFEMYRPKKKMG